MQLLGSLLAHTFASPCLGHKPKVRVATHLLLYISSHTHIFPLSIFFMLPHTPPYSFFHKHKKETKSQKKSLLGVCEKKQKDIWKKGIEKHLNQISTCNI
jgi:hypothetical protein